MKALAIASITAIALILVGRGLGDAAEKPPRKLSKAFVDADIVLDEKGKVRETTIKLSKNIYFDLDGDGVIDAFYDKRDKDGTPIVIFKGRLVPVEDFKSGFRTARNAKPTMWGIGRKEQYVFDKGVWNLK